MSTPVSSDYPSMPLVILLASRINFGDMEAALQKLSDLAESIDSIGPSELRKALEFGAQEAEGMAQDFAVRNYNASGVKTRSGDLKSAVSNARLQVANKSLLRFSLEPGKKKDFYIRANAVEYGAIRTAEGSKGTLKNVRNISDTGTTTQLHRNIGKRRRSALKKSLQGKIEKGSSTQKVARGLSLDTGSVKVTKAGSVSGQTSLGKVSVTKAHDYFKLRQGQMKLVVDEVISEAYFFLENMIGRKVK